MADFKKFLQKNFDGQKTPLLRSHPKQITKDQFSKYYIFQQNPGFPFYTATPVHQLALIHGSPGGLRVCDAGCGNGYWAVLMASQGNRVVGIDTYSINAHLKIQIFRQQGFVDIADRIEIQLGDFVPSLKKISLEDGKFDIILSFETLHFLTPKRVDEFLDNAFISLNEGGKVIGLANSPYNYVPSDNPYMVNYSGSKKALTEIMAHHAEKMRSAPSVRFPGYLVHSWPTLFTSYSYEMTDDLELFSNNFHISYPQSEDFPNMSHPSKELNLKEGEKYFDSNAKFVAHKFFRETIHEAFKRAGFRSVSTFYIDTETNNIFEAIDATNLRGYVKECYQTMLYKKSLSVGFCAMK